MESYFTAHSHLASLLITLTLLSSSSLNHTSAAAITTNTKFIKKSCSTTSYPSLCYASLYSHATAIQQSPKLLAHAALSVSLDTARSTSNDIVKLSLASGGMTHREVGAMRDCVEELSDSVDQLKRSMAEMERINNNNNNKGGSDFGMMMSNVQTWVSAALTDEDTCTDGFAGKVMNGGLKTAVRERILNVVHITSNALALINSYAQLHG